MKFTFNLNKKEFNMSKRSFFTALFAAFTAVSSFAQEIEPLVEPATPVQEEAATQVPQVEPPPPSPPPQVVPLTLPPQQPQAVPLAPPPPAAIGSLSSSCSNEFLNLPQTKSGFSFQSFLKDLPVVVTEIKVKEKAGRFGRLPPDESLTALGVSVGCVKQFPENLGQIKSLLIDQLAPEMARSMVASRMGVQRHEISPNSEAVLGMLTASMAGSSSDESGQAASDDDGGVRIGIIAGVNLSTFNYSYEKTGFNVEYGTKFGFQGGIAFDIPLSKVFYFQPSLVFIQKGLKYEYYDTYDYNNVTEKREEILNITANYIEIPLLFSVKSSVAEGVAIRINVGPYLAYAIGDGSYEEEYETKEYDNGRLVKSSSSSKSRDLFEEFKEFKEYCLEIDRDGDALYCQEYGRFDWGLSIGGGVQFSNVYIGVFYDYGLANIYTRRNSEEFGSDRNKNNPATRSRGINIGYFF